MWVAELDDVTYDLEVDGEEVRRTLQRRVWQRGGWATVVIVFQERVAGGEWKPARLALIRMQRVREGWKRHAAITLRGEEAVEIGEVIGSWQGELSGGVGDRDDDGEG